ncbi:hypothetical protein B4119_3599 [Parageobacillus caldoxylosilyticus]|uniref:Uncharacterized protein n=1 Tax=Saccharococcus caldoxylosilyticus TaxID=81408 RepID=A0A150M4H6_9BACL|nr:hypothetical protein B4119_3599 [Parageobacillus caldoxylosilyticus]
MSVERVSSHSLSSFYERIRNEKETSVIESQKQNQASTLETPQQDLPKENWKKS